jgi:hypoxanthine phosphoribosyltransferase
MHKLTLVLKKSDLKEMIAKMAEQISADYQDRELILIGVLKGSFIFLADLVRHISIPVKIDFTGASSYGSDTVSSGEIKITKKIDADLKGKDVLIVEDIIDTGLTLAYLIDYINSLGPKSIKICCLINKLERQKKKIQMDYIGREVEKGFLVGYGLDYNENYRDLAEIYDLTF